MRNLLFTLLVLVSLPAFAGTPEEEVARLKPLERDTAAQAKCQALSDDAKTRGVKTLVIAFEGWNSYYHDAAMKVYAHHWRLGHESEKPELGRMSGGVVLAGVVLPLVRRFEASFEYLHYPYTATLGGKPGSVPEICALEWVKEPGRKLAIIGHSFGGDSASQLAEQLEAREVSVSYVLTLDPVAQFGRSAPAVRRTRNALLWENFYQSAGWPYGRQIPDADLNLLVTGASHKDMVQLPVVQQSLRDRVGALPGVRATGGATTKQR